MLQINKISRKLPEYKQVCDLYKKSFPANERYPMWLIRLLAKRSFVDFIALYDNNLFCGFSYLVHYKDLTFVFYLAIDDKLRSKGYGSQALQTIIKHYAPNDIVLNIEKVEPSDNYNQRVKREKFYLKNGFVHTKYLSVKYDTPLQTMFYGKNFEKEKYEKLIRRFSFGFTTDHLKPL